MINSVNHSHIFTDTVTKKTNGVKKNPYMTTAKMRNITLMKTMHKETIFKFTVLFYQGEKNHTDRAIWLS